MCEGRVERNLEIEVAEIASDLDLDEDWLRSRRESGERASHIEEEIEGAVAPGRRVRAERFFDILFLLGRW